MLFYLVVPCIYIYIYMCVCVCVCVCVLWIYVWVVLLTAEFFKDFSTKVDKKAKSDSGKLQAQMMKRLMKIKQHTPNH